MIILFKQQSIKNYSKYRKEYTVSLRNKVFFWVKQKFATLENPDKKLQMPMANSNIKEHLNKYFKAQRFTW